MRQRAPYLRHFQIHGEFNAYSPHVIDNMPIGRKRKKAESALKSKVKVIRNDALTTVLFVG